MPHDDADDPQYPRNRTLGSGMDPYFDPEIEPLRCCERCRALAVTFGLYLNGFDGRGNVKRDTYPDPWQAPTDPRCPLCPLRGEWQADPADPADWDTATWQHHYDRYAAVRWPYGLPEHWSTADQHWEFNHWLHVGLRQ